MSAFVCDASVAVAWCFVDERTPETMALLLRAQEHGIVVPGLWRYETANVLATAMRRGRIAPDLARRAARALADLPLTIDDAAEPRAFTDILELARRENLTVYDATYLDAAARFALPLATRDRALADAAERNRLPLVLPR